MGMTALRGKGTGQQAPKLQTRLVIADRCSESRDPGGTHQARETWNGLALGDGNIRCTIGGLAALRCAMADECTLRECAEFTVFLSILTR